MVERLTASPARKIYSIEQCNEARRRFEGLKLAGAKEAPRAKHQAPSTKFLSFEFWCFTRAWMLKFGIFFRHTSQPARLFLFTNFAASAMLGERIFGPSHSMRRPTPTRSAMQPSRMISVKYAAISKFE